MFENEVFNALAIFAGFAWLALTMLICFKAVQYEIEFRRRMAKQEAAIAGRCDLHERIERSERSASL